MNFQLTRAIIAAVVILAASQSASAQLVAPAPPAVAPTTIWNRLGIPYGFNRIRDARVNRRGNNPQWERTPRLKAIADPSFLDPNTPGGKVPAIAKAAQIKQQEDLAPQKIKAVKYLAKMGCGCYDTDGSITAALVQAFDPIDECTPDVRLATIEAIRDAMEDGDAVCGSCGSTCCCNETIAMALSKSAYERNDEGCFLEPNAEVRAAAAELLRLCCPGRGPVNIIEAPIDGGGGGELRETPVNPDAPPTPDDVTLSQRNEALAVLSARNAEAHAMPQDEAPARLAPSDESLPMLPLENGELAAEPEIIEVIEADDYQLHVSETAPTEFVPPAEENYDGVVELALPPALPVVRTASARQSVAQQPAAPAGKLQAPRDAGVDRPVSFQRPPAPAAAPAPQPTARPAASPAVHTVAAHVSYVDAQNGVVHLHLPGDAVAPIGTRLNIMHEYITGKADLGTVEVVQSSEGAAIARPLGVARVWKVSRGDEAVIVR